MGVLGFFSNLTHFNLAYFLFSWVMETQLVIVARKKNQWEENLALMLVMQIGKIEFQEKGQNCK